LARLLVRRDRNFAEAEEFAKRAVLAEPGVPRYQLAYANILLQGGKGVQAEVQASEALENELSPLEGQSARALLQFAQECKAGGPCKALGQAQSGEAGEIPAALFSAAASDGSTANPSIPGDRTQGEIRAIECSPEGRVATLNSSGKDLKFKLAKNGRVSWPETFWLDSAYINACKHFVGETAAITYKDAEATALEVQDRY